MAKAAPTSSDPGYASKKCPECYTYVPLSAEVCPFCKTRIGKIGKHGMADRVTNWKAYLLCILAWLGFFIYIKWAFF